MERLIAQSDLVGKYTALQLTVVPTANWDVFETALQDVVDEMDAAIFKHSFQNTPLNQEMDLRDSFIVISEELGEVARALTYDEGNRVKLYRELIQLATMSLSSAAAVALGATSG